MLVKDLITKLQEQNPETKCLIYIGEAEEYGSTSSVKTVKSNDEMPYSKADKPEIKEEEEIVLISGWII